MMSSDNSDEYDTEGATGIDVSISEAHQPADRTKLTNEQILKLLPQQASDGNAQALLPCKESGCKAVSTAANLCNTHFCIRYRNEEIEIPFQVDKNHVVNRPPLCNKRKNVQEHKTFPNPQSQESSVHQASDHNIPPPLYKGNDISESSSSSSSEDEICKQYRCKGPMCNGNSENQNSLCDCCKGHIRALCSRHKKCECHTRSYREEHHGQLCKYCVDILAKKNSPSVNLPQYDLTPSSLSNETNAYSQPTNRGANGYGPSNNGGHRRGKRTTYDAQLEVRRRNTVPPQNQLDNGGAYGHRSDSESQHGRQTFPNIHVRRRSTAPPRNQELEGEHGINPLEIPLPPTDPSLISFLSDTGSIITHPEDDASDAQLSFF